MLLKDPRRTVHAINNRVTINVPMTTLDVNYVVNNLDYDLLKQNLGVDIDRIDTELSNTLTLIDSLDSELEKAINQINTNTSDIEELKKLYDKLAAEGLAEKIVEIVSRFDAVDARVDEIYDRSVKVGNFIDIDIEGRTLSEYVSDTIANTPLGGLSDVMLDETIPEGSVLTRVDDVWVASDIDGGEF